MPRGGEAMIAAEKVGALLWDQAVLETFRRILGERAILQATGRPRNPCNDWCAPWDSNPEPAD